MEEVGDGVVEAVGFDGVPGAEEDDVAHKDFVLEGGTEVAFWFAEGALDLTSYTGDGADACAFELCDFEGRLEHVFDEGRVFEDLVGMAGELELLDDFGAFVDVEYYAGSCDAESRCLVR